MRVLLSGFPAFILLLFAPFAQALAAPCLTPEKLSQLQQTETAYMLGRIPPAFKDAFDDQHIQLQMVPGESGKTGDCKVTLDVSLPEEDIKEARQLLENDPAKRIMLFSQGYALPETPQLSATFLVNPETLQIAHQDTLQTNALGKLRASVEMMYAMLSQSRTSPEDSPKPWSTAFMNKAIGSCVESHAGQPDAQGACTCEANALSKHYAERTMENIQYVQSNPYAAATGATTSFSKIKSEIEQGCRSRS